jgi:hypothetical protein
MQEIKINNNAGKIIKLINIAETYWAEVEYWPNGEWKHYKNSLNFNIEFNENGNRLKYYTL